MQVISHTRRVARIFGVPPILLSCGRFQSQSHLLEPIEAPTPSPLWHRFHAYPHAYYAAVPSDLIGKNCRLQYPIVFSNLFSRASFSSGAGTSEETVKELYDKIFKSVVDQRTAPPNAYLWSLIEKCANQEHIKLLFDILQRLRVFRLSNLRIHENFNCALCQEITKACVRAGAIDYGKKVLTKHNVYGLTPTIGSANHLLLHAKEKNNAKLMVDIMNLVAKNALPLQPGTADVIFSICSHTDNWELMTKYAKKFVRGGVKLRQTSFGLWMDFAAKVGDADSLWKIEKLRSERMKPHTLTTGFSCVKAFLLERKPENAAAILHVLDQSLPEAKKKGIVVELQKLISEWPLEVIKRQKEEIRKDLAIALRNDIPAMVSDLLKMGLEIKVDMESLTREDAILS